MKKFMIVFAVLFSSVVSHAQTGKDEALSTLGALAGADIYNTYSVLGSVWDNYMNKSYDADFTLTIANEQAQMISNITNSLVTLKNSGFLTDPSDIDYVNQIIQCMDMLGQQAQAMKSYVNEPSTGNSEAFQSARTKSWGMISKLLGFE